MSTIHSQKGQHLQPHLRTRARGCAVQALYAIGFSQASMDEALAGFWEMSPAKESVRRYTHKLVKGIWNDKKAIDDAIKPAVENWSPLRVGRIERNILRIAVYEMLHVDDVPHGVAINEAVELAKAFGNDESPRFINGVLDRVRKELQSDAPE